MTIADTIPWSLELHTLAGRFPDGVAVDDGQGRLTFSELNARAHALARVLAEDGAGPAHAWASICPTAARPSGPITAPPSAACAWYI